MLCDGKYSIGLGSHTKDLLHDDFTHIFSTSGINVHLFGAGLLPLFHAKRDRA